MNKPALEFAEADRIGFVAAVDTSRALIRVEDHSLLTRVGVGNLLAVRGATQQEYLIGMVERVTRTASDRLISSDEDDTGDSALSQEPDDAIRALLIGTFRSVDGSRSNVFKRGADSFPQIERECFLITAANLQSFMNLLTADVKEDERMRLGHFVMDAKAEAVAHGDRFFQRHASILGSTGCGKSYAVALILERASKLAHPNILVLDMHGEYAPLADEQGFAQCYRIAGPGELTKPSEHALFLPYWLLSRDEIQALLVDRSEESAPNQTARFTKHVRDLKRESLEASGHTEVLTTFTVDSPIPYDLSALLQRLKADDTGMKPGKANKDGTVNLVKGDWNGELTRLIGRLEAKIDDRRYGFLFHPPDTTSAYSWLHEQMARLMDSARGRQSGIKIIDFSEVPSDVLPVVAGVFARLLYDVQFWMPPELRTPISMVCDEAHLYLPVKADADAVSRRALETFERIAKEGRKYGVSLLVVSQRPSDVSKTILSQCNNFLVMRLTNDEDQNVVRRLVPDSLAGLTDMLPLLDTGEALLLGDAILLPSRMKLHMPAIQPTSATREFWKEWQSKSPSSDAIAAGVENLRSQTRSEKRSKTEAVAKPAPLK